MSDDTDLERQLQTVLEFCEEQHGHAIEYGQEGSATSLYHVIGLLEDAQDLKLKNPRDIRTTRWQAEHVRLSRETRQEGYVESTLLRTHSEDQEWTYSLGESYRKCREERPDASRVTCGFAAVITWLVQ